MKNITDFINEALNIVEDIVMEGEIKSEKDFRDAAKAKFEEVYGDDLDEDKMNDTIDGIINDNKDLVDDGDWGALIGILNKSFAPESNKEE
jgi:hypothetical protein